jgi:hypothetical protein
MMASALMLLAIIFVPNYLINKRSRFIISSKSKIVLFGHSHPECAFNDSMISNLKNLSHSAESYFYNYQKIKMVLSQNPQVETVLIEFSNNQIDEKMNEWTWGYKYMSNMFPKYNPFMDKDDIDILIKNNPGDFMNCLSISTRNNLARVLTSNYEFTGVIGGYLRIDHSQTNSTADSLNGAANKITMQRVSYINLKYLQKIINYCHAQHKKVFLVRSPQHRNYEYLKNEKEFLRIKNTMFSSVEFLDFNDFPIQDDEFADPGHLNYRGASKFSKWFNVMLDSGLLTNKNKQNLIDKSISVSKSSSKTLHLLTGWVK